MYAKSCNTNGCGCSARSASFSRTIEWAAPIRSRLVLLAALRAQYRPGTRTHRVPRTTLAGSCDQLLHVTMGCAGNIAGTIDGVVRSVRASCTVRSFTTLRGRSRDARPGVSSLLPVTCYHFTEVVQYLVKQRLCACSL